ncbi:MAG: SDR family NAD(P)-dependent oxidoreductase [Rhodobiaceae bacterium]|nr:SDR family NAD(P)-dependent oxidoreductase [Rhodobiaceae bacterium]
MKIGSGMAAVVTGGASGLGAATARHLASLGLKVGLFDMNRDAGEVLAGEIGGVFAEVDVSNAESVDAGFEKVRAKNGQERVCVNCAGIVFGQKTASRKRDTGAIQAHRADLFQKVVDVNLVGTFIVSSRAAAGMMTLEPVDVDGQRGVIVMTSSVAAQDGQLGQAAYAASKGGIASLALPMARDLSRDGIRVCGIMPGLIETPMFDSLTDELRASLASSVPFPSRLGRPEEYARLVAHIIDNDLLNGENIRLDGALRLPPK